MKDVKMVLWLITRSVIAFAGWAVLMYLMWGFSSGKIPTYHFDLALDSAENVYIGGFNYIHVFSPEGDKLYSIKAPTNREYRFTIQNDMIYVAHPGGRISMLDLQGNELSYNKTEDKEFLREIEYRRFRDADGKLYRMSFAEGRKALVAYSEEGKEVIWKMPTGEHNFRLVCIVLIVSAVLSVLSIVYQFMKNKF